MSTFRVFLVKAVQLFFFKKNFSNFWMGICHLELVYCWDISGVVLSLPGLPDGLFYRQFVL